MTKGKEVTLYVNKRVVASVDCGEKVDGVKLEMISGVLVKKVWVGLSSVDVHFHSMPVLVNVEMD